MQAPPPIGHSLFHKSVPWFSVFVLVVLGVYLSHIRFMDIEWLSRAGCLIVMIGLWSGIGGIFQERILTSRIKWRRRNAIIRARAKHTREQTDPKQIETDFNEIDDTYEKALAKNRQNLRLSIGIIEVSLLMIGTFLWGFGDLLVR